MSVTKCDELGYALVAEEYLAGLGEIYLSCLAESIGCMNEKERQEVMVPQDIVCVSKMMRGDGEEITAESLGRYCEDFRANMIRKWYSGEWKRL